MVFLCTMKAGGEFPLIKIGNFGGNTLDFLLSVSDSFFLCNQNLLYL